ncbi:hypothetical protein NHX12_002515, partial [Muraenolepis orangiensis]
MSSLIPEPQNPRSISHVQHGGGCVVEFDLKCRWPGREGGREKEKEKEILKQKRANPKP